jgi:hypothetical protein
MDYDSDFQEEFNQTMNDPKFLKRKSGKGFQSRGFGDTF